MARPPVEDYRNYKVVGYLNDVEKAKFKELLANSVYRNQSEMIRDIILNNRYKVVSVDQNMVQEKAIIVTQIKKIGTNFNSLLRLLHTKKLNYFTQNDIKQLRESLISLNEFFKSNSFK